MYDVFLRRHGGPWCVVGTADSVDEAREVAGLLHDRDGYEWESRYYWSGGVKGEDEDGKGRPSPANQRGDHA